jgi:hypothetical protein
MDSAQIQETLQKGIRAAKRGKKEPAQHLLTQVVQADPNNEEAWMWLARVVEDPVQKADCLQHILNLNPNNQWAAEQLQALQTEAVAPTAPSLEPAAVEDVEQPPLEPVSGDYELEMLQCPNCGAPLEIHTGHQAKTIVCSACASLIDLTPEQAAVIGQASKKVRAMVPLDLGMEATLDGVLYQVVGWLRYEGSDDEDRWRWDEWLLASAEGEFRWLTYDPEAGFVLQKKVPLAGPIDVRRATSIPVPDGQAQVSERAQAKIIGLAGELTWRAKIGDRIYYLDAKKNGTLYSAEATQEEVELLAGQVIPEEAIWQGFGNQTLVNALQGLGQKRRAYQRVALACVVFIILSICATCALPVGGSSVFQENTKLMRGEDVLTSPFEIKNTTQAHQITMSASNATNNWGEITVHSLDSREEKTFLFSKTFGVGDNRVSHYFRPSQTGEHRLVLLLKDGQITSADVTVNVKQGLWTSYLFLFFAVICIGLGIVFFVLGRGSSPPYSHTLARTAQPKKE